MILIHMNDNECILKDDNTQFYGTKEVVVSELVQRLSRRLGLFDRASEVALTAEALNEVAFAFECMASEGAVMASFGFGGHFIRTLQPEVILPAAQYRCRLPALSA